MNNRDTILKIIRHPLIKQIMENKMATTSIVTKVIAEELQYKNILEQEQQNSVNKLLEVIEKYQEVFDLINPELTPANSTPFPILFPINTDPVIKFPFPSI